MTNSNQMLVVDAEPLEVIEAPVSVQDVFEIIGAAAALGAAIAGAVS